MKVTLLLGCGAVCVFVACLWLAGFEVCSGTSSYFLPAESIGVTLESEEDANVVRKALAVFAQRRELRLYRPTDVPFFAEENRKDPSLHWERITYYLPPGRCSGFEITQIEYLPKCLQVRVSERSESWTPKSLEAVRSVEQLLAAVAPGRVAVLVRAKPQQNFPEQRSVPEVDVPPSERTPCEWNSRYDVVQ